MKKYLFLFLFLLSFSGYAQNTVNNYKYVIVPERFNFLKQNDQYKLNTLTKNLLNGKGFEAYFENSDLPAEAASNKCSVLNLDLLEKNSMFTTNITILLKDCSGNIIFKSKEGKSREKQYEISYNAALRDAFESLNDYAYTTPATNTNEQQKAIVVPVTATQPVTAAQPVTAVQPAAKVTAVAATQVAGTLYAQPTANGYQLIDTTPKKVLTLSKTSVENYFIAENGSSNGIVFKKGENWIFEYYKNGTLTAEKLLIKF